MVFQDFDPEVPPEARGPAVVVALMCLAFAASFMEFVGAKLVWFAQERDDVKRAK